MTEFADKLSTCWTRIVKDDSEILAWINVIKLPLIDNRNNVGEKYWGRLIYLEEKINISLNIWRLSCLLNIQME